jgi:hypothetical protein
MQLRGTIRTNLAIVAQALEESARNIRAFMEQQSR